MRIKLKTAAPSDILKGIIFLPDSNHSLPILVLLFVHVNMSSCHVLNGRDVATSSAHDPRHNRGWHRQLL